MLGDSFTCQDCQADTVSNTIRNTVDLIFKVAMVGGIIYLGYKNSEIIQDIARKGINKAHSSMSGTPKKRRAKK